MIDKNSRSCKTRRATFNVVRQQVIHDLRNNKGIVYHVLLYENVRMTVDDFQKSIDIAGDTTLAAKLPIQLQRNP